MYDFLSFEMLDLKIGIMQYLFEDIPDRGWSKDEVQGDMESGNWGRGAGGNVSQGAGIRIL